MEPEPPDGAAPTAIADGRPPVGNAAPDRGTDARARRPRAFVSYAHDSDSHKAEVLRFCRFLGDECDIDVHVDQEYADVRRDWPSWAAEQIRAADFVLVVVSPKYKRCAEDRADPSECRGSRYEASLLRDRLTEDQGAWTRKILPVVLPGRSVSDIPDFLTPYSADHYIVTAYTRAGTAELLKALTGQALPNTFREEEAGSSVMSEVEQDPSTADAMRQIHQFAYGTAEYASVQQAAGNINNTTTYYPPWYGRRNAKIVLLVLLGLAVIAALAWALWPEPGWREVLRRQSVKLVPETLSCLGVEDKVDLDTGQRGQGEQPPLPGCDADGGLAELIIDKDAIHTSSVNRDYLLPVGRGTNPDADTCDGLLGDSTKKPTDSIPRTELQNGDQLCVRTSEDRVALVTFTQVARSPDGPTLISFVVWEKP